MIYREREEVNNLYQITNDEDGKYELCCSSKKKDTFNFAHRNCVIIIFQRQIITSVGIMMVETHLKGWANLSSSYGYIHQIAHSRAIS